MTDHQSDMTEMTRGHPHEHPNGTHEHRPIVKRARNQRALAIVLVMALVYMIAEIVGGLVTNSLALLADAGHMFSDVAALGLSIFAIRMVKRPPSPTQTYGYYRAEILAALFNGALLVAIALFIIIEAFRRVMQPPEVAGAPMLGVAIGGLLVNAIGLWILHSGKKHSLNIRGAWLHVLADLLGSVGAIIAGILIWKFHWYWADPVTSVLIAQFIILSSWSLLRQSVSVLMEGAPSHIDVDRLRAAVVAVPGVTQVHDLHVWSITSGMEALSAHIVVPAQESHDRVLGQVRSVIAKRFGINHVTLQIEPILCDEIIH